MDWETYSLIEISRGDHQTRLKVDKKTLVPREGKCNIKKRCILMCVLKRRSILNKKNE